MVEIAAEACKETLPASFGLTTLPAEGLSPRQAGIATGLPRTTVGRYVVKAIEAGLGGPLPPYCYCQAKVGPP